MATRVGYAMLFCFDALLAWISLTPSLARSIEDWTFHYVQVKCIRQETCIGVLAVHRITLALAVFHVVLGLMRSASIDSERMVGTQNSLIARCDHGYVSLAEWGYSGMG